ncbi:30S ribosomal protein S9 [Candidatus Pacearchaeota archaeon]|nr:30S ribosomal protein S9 [Candidatus Pacearchaeota archaeon]
MKALIRTAGKRKTSVAKIKLTEGNGKVHYNNGIIENMKMFHKLSLLEPIRMYESTVGKMPYDIYLKVVGGGKESQIQAARLAIAKSLVAVSKSSELKEAYLKYDRHMLVADVRRKEQRKPGDSKARAKRQKSYR